MTVKEITLASNVGTGYDSGWVFVGDLYPWSVEVQITGLTFYLYVTNRPNPVSGDVGIQVSTGVAANALYRETSTVKWVRFKTAGTSGSASAWLYGKKTVYGV